MKKFDTFVFQYVRNSDMYEFQHVGNFNVIISKILVFQKFWQVGNSNTLNSTYNEVTFNKKSAITKENLCTKYTPFTYKYITPNEKPPIMKQNLHIFFFHYRRSWMYIKFPAFGKSIRNSNMLETLIHQKFHQKYWYIGIPVYWTFEIWCVLIIPINAKLWYVQKPVILIQWKNQCVRKFDMLDIPGIQNSNISEIQVCQIFWYIGISDALKIL